MLLHWSFLHPFNRQVTELSRCDRQLQSGVLRGLPLSLSLFFRSPSYLMKARKEGHWSPHERRFAAVIARVSEWLLSDPQCKCRPYSCWLRQDFLQVSPSGKGLRGLNPFSGVIQGNSQGRLIGNFDQNWRNKCSLVTYTGKKTSRHHVKNIRDGRGSVRNSGRCSQNSVVGIVIKVRAGQFGVWNALEARGMFLLEIVLGPTQPPIQWGLGFFPGG